MPGKDTTDEANQYDKIFKENLQELVLPMLRQYWRWMGARSAHFDPADASSPTMEIVSMKSIPHKLQTTTEREADFLSEVTDVVRVAEVFQPVEYFIQIA